MTPAQKEERRRKRFAAAMRLAADLLSWDAQFGGPPDAECIVAGEDFARWIEMARKVVGK